MATAKARLEYALDQVDVCRKWSSKLPKMIGEEYEGAARQLGNFLEIELAGGIALLNGRIGSLHAYTSVKPSVAPAKESR